MNDWLNKKKNWLNKPRRKKPQPQPQPQDPDPYGVTWRPIRCPKKSCQSKNILIRRTMPGGTIRYCKCRTCGKTFKAVEEDI